MCPVCTVATVAGLSISRILGIDDTITSVWIGGLILSSSFWLISWLKKKWPKLSTINYELLTISFAYLLVLVPLKIDGSIGIVRNTIWGIDKIILGTFSGSAFFLAGIYADVKERKVKGKQLFSFQKVVFPVLGLIIASLIFYLITKI